MTTLLELARRAVEQNLDARSKVDVKMTLAQFAVSGKVVRIRSEVLGCDVIFAADNADPAKAGAAGLPIYWAREFKHLIGMSAKDLTILKECKIWFGGEVTG